MTLPYYIEWTSDFGTFQDADKPAVWPWTHDLVGTFPKNTKWLKMTLLHF